jgi:hypothetical protein
MGNHTAIAVDVAKNVFELGISDRPGVVRRKERLQRPHFLTFLAAQPAARESSRPTATRTSARSRSKRRPIRPLSRCTVCAAHGWRSGRRA